MGFRVLQEDQLSLEVVVRIHEEAQMIPQGQVVVLDLAGLLEEVVLVLEEESPGVHELVQLVLLGEV